MTNRSDYFKCCSNLFVSILLLNIVVIITVAYILVVYHVSRDVGNVSFQPVEGNSVPRNLAKPSVSSQDHHDRPVEGNSVAKNLAKPSMSSQDHHDRPVEGNSVAKNLAKPSMSSQDHHEGPVKENSVAKNLAKPSMSSQDHHGRPVEGNSVAKNLAKPSVSSQDHHEGKTKVIIFIGIMTAPRLISRRNALRKSWLTRCKGIPCLFFSDGQDMYGNKLPDHIIKPLQQEQSVYKDLILAQSPGGINFARRYLWILNWANERYQFEYFLRMDDDYFVCMDRLLMELPHRSRKKLYWGHVHCHPPGGVRVDEGFVIVSNDLAQTFLREQNKTLKCHAYGDQAMMMWINDIPGVTYFGDPRVHHEVVNKDNILQHEDICEDFLALHGSYPPEVALFWQHMKKTKEKYTIPPVTYPCGTMSKTFIYQNFGGMYNAVPRLCRENPVWHIGNFYGGRSG